MAMSASARSRLAGRRNRGVPLKIVIALTYIGLVACCAVAIAALTYRENSKLILSIAKDSFAKTGSATIDNTQYLLQPVGAAVDAMATLIEEDPTLLPKASMSKFLYEMAVLYPQIYSAYVAVAETGEFVQVQRLPEHVDVWGPDNFPVPPGSRFVLRSIFLGAGSKIDSYRYVEDWDRLEAEHFISPVTYDPRSRPFYDAAIKVPQHVLTDSYVFASNGKLGITIARRLEQDGKLLGVVAADITLESLSKFLIEQPVGAHGVAIIVDEHGDIVAAPNAPPPRPQVRAVADLRRPELDQAWKRYAADRIETFVFENAGQEFVAAFYPFPSSFDKPWTIMEVAPVDDFVGTLKQTIRLIGWLSLAIATMGGLGSLLIAGQITKPIETLTHEADEIRSLSFSGKMQTSSNILEIGRLIDSMTAMKAAIRTFVGDDRDQASFADSLLSADPQSPSAKLLAKVQQAVEAKRSRETELNLAATIQRSVLPVAEEGEDSQPVDIAARMRPAREVGGDFYDWLWRDESRFAFVIGDVSDKGVPAALFMASTRTAIRALYMSGASLQETLVGVNRLLSENNAGCFFVTMFIAELDVATGRLTYINAGHEPARLLHAAGGDSVLHPTGPAAGVIEEADFGFEEIAMQAGDALVTLTDGVTDAMNASGARFGEDGLTATLAATRFDRPANVVDRLVADVDAFAGDQQQFDDITCLAIRLNRLATEAGA